jgi:hypothetical protein
MIPSSLLVQPRGERRAHCLAGCEPVGELEAPQPDVQRGEGVPADRSPVIRGAQQRPGLVGDPGPLGAGPVRLPAVVHRPLTGEVAAQVNPADTAGASFQAPRDTADPVVHDGDVVRQVRLVLERFAETDDLAGPSVCLDGEHVTGFEQVGVHGHGSGSPPKQQRQSASRHREHLPARHGAHTNPSSSSSALAGMSARLPSCRPGTPEPLEVACHGRSRVQDIDRDLGGGRPAGGVGHGRGDDELAHAAAGGVVVGQEMRRMYDFPLSPAKIGM